MSGPAPQWQMLPGLISKLAPSGSAATLGGGLVALGGLLSVIDALLLNAGYLSQVVLGTAEPSSVPVLNIPLRWVVIFGPLVVGVVALVAARRHLVTVAAVALAVQVIAFGYAAWESLNRGHPIPVPWHTLLYILAFCLLLALALSRRATTVLKLITLAAFAVLLVYLIVFTHYDVTGDARILAVMWIGFAACFIDKAGWLVLVAGVKAPDASQPTL